MMFGAKNTRPYVIGQGDTGSFNVIIQLFEILNITLETWDLRLVDIC